MLLQVISTRGQARNRSANFYE